MTLSSVIWSLTFTDQILNFRAKFLIFVHKEFEFSRLDTNLKVSRLYSKIEYFCLFKSRFDCFPKKIMNFRA